MGISPPLLEDGDDARRHHVHVLDVAAWPAGANHLFGDEIWFGLRGALVPGLVTALLGVAVASFCEDAPAYRVLVEAFREELLNVAVEGLVQILPQLRSHPR